MKYRSELLIILTIITFCLILGLIFIISDERGKDIKISYEPIDTTLINEDSIIELPPETTRELKLHIENKASSSKFTPISYGYTTTDAKVLFKYLQRKKCVPMGIFKKLEDGSISASCGNSPMLGVENSFKYKEKMGKSDIVFTVETIGSEKVLNKSSEYHYIKCSAEISDVYLRNIKNFTSLNRAKNKTNELRNHYGTKELRPLTIIAFYIDSASRQLIYRNLPKTIEYLNKVIDENSNYKVYEFLINNAIKAFTVPNMTPLNLGISYSTMEKKFTGNYIEQSAEALLTLQEEKSLFTHFRDMGFVTMFTSDAVADTMAYILGRKALVDHQVSNFWKMGNQFYGLDEFKDKDICMGSHPAHYYTLSYLDEFLENYAGTSKFAFAHINTAHESTGSKLNTADEDFEKYLRKLLDNFDFINEDLVFMLGGDHGTSKGDFMTIEGLAERVMASQFLIANTKLLKRLKSEEFLRMNTRLPVSRYDWYKTLKFLSYAPYTELDINSQEYEKIETEYTSFSLFHEPADESRTCSDLGVFDLFCLSRKFEKVDRIQWSNDIFKYFLSTASEKLNIHLTKKPKCPKISLNKIKEFEKFSFDITDPSKSTTYLIQVSADSNPESLFLIHATKGDQNQYNNLKDKFLFGGFRRTLLKRVEKINYYTIDMVWEIYRLGPLSTIEELKETNKCENNIKVNHNMYLGMKGETCNEMCEKVKLDFNRPIFYETILNYLNRTLGSLEVLGEFDSFELEDGKLIQGRGHFCTNKPIIGQGICFCSLRNEDPWEGIEFS